MHFPTAPSFGRLRLLAISAFSIIIASIILLSFDTPTAVISQVPAYFHHHNEPSTPPPPPDEKAPEEGSPISQPKHEYARAVVRPRFKTQVEDTRLVKISSPLLSPFVSSSDELFAEQDTIVDIDVLPNPSDTSNVESKILAGYATQIKRLQKFMPTILTTLGSHASAVALVGPLTDPELRDGENQLQSLGLNVTLYSSDLPFTSEYFSLVNVFARYTDSHDWFITLDDDTFFPSTITLIAERLSHLDPSQPYYIGANSDSALQHRNHGGWPHGGGGVILSRAMISLLATHYDECVAEYHSSIPAGGDHRLFLCSEIAERYLPNYATTGAGTLSNFTIWPELKQWDIGGRAEGVFEGGIKMWSFHHWVSTKYFDSPEHAYESALVTQLSGTNALLQRYIFNETEFTTPGPDPETTIKGKEYYILTNGYSVTRYRIPDVSLVNFADIDHNKIEYTWIDTAEDYVISQGENRPWIRDVKGVEAMRWRLRDAKVGEDGEIRQFYWSDYESLRGDRAGHPVEPEEGDVESLIEVVWLKPTPPS